MALYVFVSIVSLSSMFKRSDLFLFKLVDQIFFLTKEELVLYSLSFAFSNPQLRKVCVNQKAIIIISYFALLSPEISFL